MRVNYVAAGVLCIYACALQGGCVSTSVVRPDAPAIVLEQAQTRQIALTTFTFPAGLYTPSFQTKNGIYYKAPSACIWKSLGIAQSLNGGVFIPFRAAPDQRQAAWIDERQTSDAIDYLTTQPTNRHPFKPSLQIRYVDAAALYRSLPTTQEPTQ